MLLCSVENVNITLDSRMDMMYLISGFFNGSVNRLSIKAKVTTFGSDAEY